MDPKEVLEYIARNLVDDPDAVEVTKVEGQGSLILRLTVAPEDMGKVIGRGGRTAKAIRTVVRAAAQRQGHGAMVDIED